MKVRLFPNYFDFLVDRFGMTSWQQWRSLYFPGRSLSRPVENKKRPKSRESLNEGAGKNPSWEKKRSFPPYRVVKGVANVSARCCPRAISQAVLRSKGSSSPQEGRGTTVIPSNLPRSSNKRKK